MPLESLRCMKRTIQLVTSSLQQWCLHMETLLVWCSCRCVHEHKRLQDVFTQEELNLHQRRWLEFLKDYDMSMQYHPSKSNVVENDLSRLSMGSVAHVRGKKKGASEGCSQTCSLGSLPYKHIWQLCNTLE